MNKLGTSIEIASHPHRMALLLFLAAVSTLCADPANPTATLVPDSTGPSVKLDRFEVQGRTERIPPTLSQSVVGSTSLEADALSGTVAQSLEEVLRVVPGVQARSRAGDDVFLSVRGSGLQSIVFTKARGTDILIDGIPTNSADGNFDYSLIDPLAAEALDVFRGAAATGFGSNTLGGALNLATPTGRDPQSRTLRLDAGSFGFLRASAGFGVASEKWDATARYTRQQQDGFRDYTAADADKFSSSFGRRLSANAENRVFVQAARVHQEVSLPITQKQVESDPTQAGAANPATQPYFDVETVRLADKLTFSTSETQIEASAFYLYKYVDFRRPSVATTGYRLGPGWLDATTHDLGAQLRMVHTGALLGRKNTLSGGLRIGHLSGTEKLYPNLATVRGAKFADGDLTAWNASLWLENDHQLAEGLALVASVKAAYASRKYEDNFNVGAANISGDQDYRAVSPALALRWEVAPKAQVFASVNRTFEPPAFGDLIGIPIVPPPPQRISFRRLDAQEATTFELGTRGATGRLSWEASLYRSWLDNEIIRYDDGTQTGNQVGRNADRTLHDGFELGLGAQLWQSGAGPRPAHRLSLHTTYTWNRYRFDDDPTFGNRSLAGVPVHTLFSELLLEHGSGLYFGVNVSGSLKDYAADNANTYFVHRYALLGLRAGWEGRRLSLRIEARNLTDQAYVAALQNATNLGGADSAIFFPGTGRAVFAGLEWRW